MPCLPALNYRQKTVASRPTLQKTNNQHLVLIKYQNFNQKFHNRLVKALMSKTHINICLDIIENIPIKYTY